ncbi:MAG: 1-acyl-sn-glycerol-3-phosphate acyltransferase, partial [Clostridia bacterium]|nr:1-acyl-sn-glycerol-3-phosphate acyltransferase [Clostridia bacterium]
MTVKKDRGITFDKDYPYIDESRGFGFRRALVSLLLHTVVFPVAAIRLGLKVKGRENLKKNKELFKHGVISCSNHVHFWDFIAIMRTVKPFRPYVVTWARNINGESGTLIRLVGGIPIPENDMHASRAFGNAVGRLLNGGGWLHFYAEGSMWEYYRPIRPFKNGAAYFACKYDKPVIPLAFSYREPGFIRR